jgi:hypothetical protein
MALANQIATYLKQLTPFTRGNLLNELERLALCGAEVPGVSSVLEALRAEFRPAGQEPNRTSHPSRYFFAPLEPLLVDSDPDHPNPGRISRGSLSPIWEWITHDLLPTMARDYTAQMTGLIAHERQREARQVTGVFQTKVVKSLENTLSSPAAAEQVRARLAIYTASHSVFHDLGKMLCVLRARDALTSFEQQLPAKISNFDDKRGAAVAQFLDAFAKNNNQALPFALTLIANRLKTGTQLLGLASRGAASREASDLAAAPYAIAVTMVLDRIDDMRLALRIALRNERVVVAKQLLTHIYDTEYELQIGISHLDQSEWGARLHKLMEAIAALVEAEVSRFPADIGHVLGSRRLRRHDSLAGRLTYLASKGRGAVHEGAAFCRRLIGQD